MGALKGPSNHYGNARNGNQGKMTIHIGYRWAKSFNKASLLDHYTRHGVQIACPSSKSYSARAVKFANLVNRKECVSFIDNRGTTYKFNKRTNEFAVITKSGMVVTYFIPQDGYKYYLKQKKMKKR